MRTSKVSTDTQEVPSPKENDNPAPDRFWNGPFRLELALMTVGMPLRPERSEVMK